MSRDAGAALDTQVALYSPRRKRWRQVTLAGFILAVILATVYWGFKHWRIKETREVLQGSFQRYGVAPTEADEFFAAWKRADLTDAATVQALGKRAKRIFFKTHVPSDAQLRETLEFLLNSVGFKAYRAAHNYQAGPAGAANAEALVRLLLTQLPAARPGT